MSKALGEFDSLTIVETGLGPSLGEMVGVEFVNALVVAGRADDDALAGTTAFLDAVDSATDGNDGFDSGKIAHATLIVTGSDAGLLGQAIEISDGVV